MLVLTRKSGESIQVGVNVEVKVLEIKQNSVRLGIVAPKEISVHRKEIYELIQQENILAAKGKKSLLQDLGEIFKKHRK
jgi:carbon storage regulator